MDNNIDMPNTWEGRDNYKSALYRGKGRPVCKDCGFRLCTCQTSLIEFDKNSVLIFEDFRSGEIFEFNSDVELKTFIGKYAFPERLILVNKNRVRLCWSCNIHVKGNKKEVFGKLRFYCCKCNRWLRE